MATHTGLPAAAARGLIYGPGVTTPSEAFTALKAGAAFLKLFPAEMIPPAAVQAIRTILPLEARLLPVGGITRQAMAPYRAARADGFGLGSALYAPEHHRQMLPGLLSVLKFGSNDAVWRPVLSAFDWVGARLDDGGRFVPQNDVPIDDDRPPRRPEGSSLRYWASRCVRDLGSRVALPKAVLKQPPNGPDTSSDFAKR
ncbi:hypothetical protein [Ancylobacter rudongensis]|nr:hypothetical protein [Ancylobacter rudongensis]